MGFYIPAAMLLLWGLYGAFTLHAGTIHGMCASLSGYSGALGISWSGNGRRKAKQCDEPTCATWASPCSSR